jgi:hypothetical protein
MAMALSIWFWSSPATGAGFVGDGGVDGFGVDGVFVGVFVDEFVGAAAVRGVLPGWGLVRLRLRDAGGSVPAARSAWSASFGAATVTAFDLASGVALAGETTFDEAPILLSTMLAATQLTTVGSLDPFAWRPRRGRRCRPDAFPGGWSLSVLFCTRRA